MKKYDHLQPDAAYPYPRERFIKTEIMHELYPTLECKSLFELIAWQDAIQGEIKRRTKRAVLRHINGKTIKANIHYRRKKI